MVLRVRSLVTAIMGDMMPSIVQNVVEYLVTYGRNFKPRRCDYLNTQLQDQIEYTVTWGRGFDERPRVTSELVKKLGVFADKIAFQKDIQQILASSLSTCTKLNLVHDLLSDAANCNEK